MFWKIIKLKFEFRPFVYVMKKFATFEVKNNFEGEKVMSLLPAFNL